MSQPTACIRCKGTELVEARFEGAENLRLVIDSEHQSRVAARVCVACGAVLLTAMEPGALRSGPESEREVQEFDF